MSSQSPSDLIALAEKQLSRADMEVAAYEYRVAQPQGGGHAPNPDDLVGMYSKAKRAHDELVGRTDDGADFHAVRLGDRLQTLQRRIATRVGPYVYDNKPTLGSYPQSPEGGVEVHVRRETALLADMIPLLERIFYAKHNKDDTSRDEEFVKELAQWQSKPLYWTWARLVLKKWELWDAVGTRPGLADVRPKGSGSLRQRDAEDRRRKERRRPGPEIENTAAALGRHAIERMTGYAELNVAYAREEGEETADEHYWITGTHGDVLQWRLRPGVSASEGIRAWVTGKTRADCASVVCAAKTDALRAALGDDQFDKMFGHPGRAPALEFLEVGAYATGTTVNKYLLKPNVGVGTIGNRPVEEGSWHYFSNHPLFPLRHSQSLWSGLHAVYLGTLDGKQRWTGMGAQAVTELELYDKMVGKYNEKQSDEDAQTFRPVHVPNEITRDKLLNDPATTLDGRERKGGFNTEAAKLNIKAIAELKSK